MKKNTILLAILCLFNLNSNAQCVQKGNSLIDLYWGGPNLYAAIFRTAVTNQNSTNITVSSWGQVGAKYEYMLTDIFGMGLDVNYSSFSVSFRDLNTANIYTYKYTSPDFRAMLGFNFHFVHADKIDAYAAIKTGYLNRTFTATSNDPNFTAQSVNFPIPVALRIEAGMRYFFTETVGLHVNIGIGGGPIAAGGLALKF